MWYPDACYQDQLCFTNVTIIQYLLPCNILFHTRCSKLHYSISLFFTNFKLFKKEISRPLGIPEIKNTQIFEKFLRKVRWRINFNEFLPMPRSRLLYYPSIFPLTMCRERERESTHRKRSLVAFPMHGSGKLRVFEASRRRAHFLSSSISLDTSASNKGGSFANISRSESRSRRLNRTCLSSIITLVLQISNPNYTEVERS